MDHTNHNSIIHIPNILIYFGEDFNLGKLARGELL